MQQQSKQREDINTTDSSLTGFSWLIEVTLRRFRILFHIVVLLLMYAVVCLLMGISALPGVYFFQFVSVYTQSWPQLWHYLALGFALAASFFLYGFSLILVVPLANFLFRTSLKPSRGIYFSIQTIRWYIHNLFTYVVRYTFLKFVTPTPFNTMFYRLMGMKIGKGAQINTTNISDPSLLDIGENASIGGSATLICHYGVGGYLIISPVRIGKKATVGLRAIIMGDVEIGDGAKVLPNSVVMPKTKIPAGEIWGGVPAVCVRESKGDSDS